MALAEAGIVSERVYKVNEGRPNVVDMIIEKKIDLIVNTPLGRQSKYDELAIRSSAIQRNIPLVTTMAAARAIVLGLGARRKLKPTIKALQDYHREIGK